MKNTRVLPHAIEEVRGNFGGHQHPKTCKVFYKKTGRDVTTNNMQQPQILSFYQTEVIIIPTQTMHYIDTIIGEIPQIYHIFAFFDHSNG